MENNMNNDKLFREGQDLLQKVRERKPIVHHITNYVTVNDCANIVLALGGSPIMADEICEVEQIVDISDALVLNIGTLNSRTFESMCTAALHAKEKGIPIVIDAVGAGATFFRTDSVHQLISIASPSVIKGNLSEILSVAGSTSHTAGVDVSQKDDPDNISKIADIAHALARKVGCIVAVTGKTDIICDSTHVVTVENGTSRLSQITGTGCMSSSMVATLCAASSCYLTATATAIAVMAIAGETAETAEGLGTFHSHLIDAVSLFESHMLRKRGRLYVREY